MRLLESLADAEVSMVLSEHPGWTALRGEVESATRKCELRRAEDRVDAALCAYIALYAHRRPAALITYGDFATGLHRHAETSGGPSTRGGAVPSIACPSRIPSRRLSNQVNAHSTIPQGKESAGHHVLLGRPARQRRHHIQRRDKTDDR